MSDARKSHAWIAEYLRLESAEMARLQAEVIRLQTIEVDLQEMRRDWGDAEKRLVDDRNTVMVERDNLRTDLATVLRERDEARGDLAPYARHLAGCYSTTNHNVGPCDCGLSAALSAPTPAEVLLREARDVIDGVMEAPHDPRRVARLLPLLARLSAHLKETAPCTTSSPASGAASSGTSAPDAVYARGTLSSPSTALGAGHAAGAVDSRPSTVIVADPASPPPASGAGGGETIERAINFTEGVAFNFQSKRHTDAYVGRLVDAAEELLPHLYKARGPK